MGISDIHMQRVILDLCIIYHIILWIYILCNQCINAEKRLFQSPDDLPELHSRRNMGRRRRRNGAVQETAPVLPSSQG